MNTAVLPRHVAGTCFLVGNPNTGKTSLFNRLTGLRSKTANFPGVTVDVRRGTILPRFCSHNFKLHLVDCPGLYSLDAVSRDEQATIDLLRTCDNECATVLLVLDATNLNRNLLLTSQMLERKHRMLVAVNLIDEANSRGITIDPQALAERLGCPVVLVSARTGEGIEQLVEQIYLLQKPQNVSKLPPSPPAELEQCIGGCRKCSFANRFAWSDQVTQQVVRTSSSESASVGAGAISVWDRWLTNRVTGPIVMLLVMFCMFALIFSFADLPMGLIEEGFGRIGEATERLLSMIPENIWLWRVAIFVLCLATIACSSRLAEIKSTGRVLCVGLLLAVLISFLPREDFTSLAINGIVAGIGGVVVFLPQICILFFFISLLEDSGYLARGAFVMERFMRRVGLPGAAFVPMLSAHACAIPGIMAARTIESRRDRLVTILVLPLLTCSARLPVYAMVATLLFKDSPWMGAAVFVAAYSLGITAALTCAYLLKITVARGAPEPLVIELPPYRMPSLQNALLTVYDRARDFLANAGSIILLISVVLWFMASYPKLPPGTFFDLENGRLVSLTDRTANEIASSNSSFANLGTDDPAFLQSALAYSYAGRLGRWFEPVFKPLGFDWKINVGVISSFAAREVVVSALSIVYGLGEDGTEDEEGLTATLRRQTYQDGSPVFSTATCLSLLVFFVLAMQCLPTQAVTRRETSSWKWAAFQFLFMSALAYASSFVVYQFVSRLG